MKYVRRILTSLIALVVFVAILEISYQHQIIDFYSTEYNHFNSDLPDSSKKTILVFGDSFSAQEDGYVQQLKAGLKRYKIVNASIPGTSIDDVNLISERRIRQTNPDAIVLQIYPANDLSDISKPMNWDSLSFCRNLYWKWSERLTVLPYINYKLGQFSFSEPKAKIENIEDSSSLIETYSEREKLFINSNPSLLSEHLHLSTAPAKATFAVYESELRKFLKSIAEIKNVYILMIPHCTRIGDFYYEQYTKIGAKLPEKSIHYQPEHEFSKSVRRILAEYENVTFVNPTTVLQSVQGDNAITYYLNDPHLTEKGSNIVSEFLGYHLVRDGVISH